jgi:hypothetical protein
MALPRIATGMTMASFCLAIAVGLLAAGYAVEGWATAALTGLGVIGTFAPWIPGLRKLPVIGAKTPVTAAFHVNGSIALRVRFPPDDRTRSVQLQVGIMSSRPLDGALINLSMPAGLYPAKTDHNGREEDDGRWMPPGYGVIDGESRWFDYWAHVRDLPKGATLVWFGLRFSEAGDYPVMLTIDSGDMWEEFSTTATISVVESPDMTPVDCISDVISESEALRARLEADDGDGGDMERREVAAMSLGAGQAVPANYPEGDALLRVEPRYSGPRIGRPWHLALLNRNVEALYEIRRRLGMRDDQRGRNHQT